MNTFTRKSLYAALAGVGALGVTGAAQAVNVNPNGLGQVLLYPYYTVRTDNLGNPYNSLLSVVNSTNSVKAGKVREATITPPELSGGTFTVSTLGMYGIDSFSAVINPPQAGILAVGAMTPKPVVRDGQIVVRQLMRVTMSCDHRVIDGATGAKFLQTFKQLLENPLLML